MFTIIHGLIGVLITFILIFCISFVTIALIEDQGVRIIINFAGGCLSGFVGVMYIVYAYENWYTFKE